MQVYPECFVYAGSCFVALLLTIFTRDHIVYYVPVADVILSLIQVGLIIAIAAFLLSSIHVEVWDRVRT